MAQPNSAPSYVPGGDLVVDEDAGPQTVPWASDVAVHGFGVPEVTSPIVYGSDFSSQPDGSALYDDAQIADGVLKLTLNVNNMNGSFYGPVVPVPLESYDISFKLLIGGGSDNPADGMSLNVANNLPTPPNRSGSEEGMGSGLTLSFDIHDNGGVVPQEAPSIDLKYQGQLLSGFLASVAQSTDPAQDIFIPVTVSVSADGLATVTYDGTNVFENVPLPNYRWQSGLQLGLVARTGGLNANQFVDDLQLSAVPYDPAGPERGQTAQFIVSNDNPDLFAEPPAISPDGTLTYTPAPDACGSAVVTVVLEDDGGTDLGGSDRTAASQFTITVNPLNDSCPIAEDQMVAALAGTPTPFTLHATDLDNDTGCGAAPLSYWVMLPAHGWLSGTPPNLVYTSDPGYCGADSFMYLVEDTACFNVATVSLEVQGVNQCPVANAQNVTTCEDSPAAIVLTGSDADENGCGPTIQGFAIVASPTHGTLSGTAPNLTYTPAADYNGPDNFTFTATDGECVSVPAVVSIVVMPANDGPICQIFVGPVLRLTPDVVESLVLSCDNQTAEVMLDATLSSDPDNDGMTYLWAVDGTPVGNAALQSVAMQLGTHEVTLTVTDDNPGTGPCAGNGTSTCSAMVTVIDGCEAVEELVMLVQDNSATIGADLQRTFNKELKDACKEFAKGKCKNGVKRLRAFQDKVRNYDEFYKKPSKKVSAKKRLTHETAMLLVDASQALIDAYAPCACMGLH